MSAPENVQNLPVLPLKNSVLFPHLLMPLAVGRQSTLAAAEAVLATEEKEVVVVGQRDPSQDALTAEDLFSVGTKAVIKKMARPDESQIELIVLGHRARGHPQARADRAVPEGPRSARCRCPTMPRREVEALYRAVLELAARVLELAAGRSAASDIDADARRPADDPLRLAYLLGSMLSLDVAKEQALLEAASRGRSAAPAARLPDARSAGAGAAQQDRQPGADGDEQGAARVHAAPADAGHPGGAGREESGEGRGRDLLRERLAEGRPARRGPQGGRARAGAPGAAARAVARATR